MENKEMPKRTQIFVSDDLYQELKKLKLNHKSPSFGYLIRHLIKEYYRANELDKKLDSLYTYISNRQNNEG